MMTWRWKLFFSSNLKKEETTNTNLTSAEFVSLKKKKSHHPRFSLHQKIFHKIINFCKNQEGSKTKKETKPKKKKENFTYISHVLHSWKKKKKRKSNGTLLLKALKFPKNSQNQIIEIPSFLGFFFLNKSKTKTRKSKMNKQDSYSHHVFLFSSKTTNKDK